MRLATPQDQGTHVAGGTAVVLFACAVTGAGTCDRTPILHGRRPARLGAVWLVPRIALKGELKVPAVPQKILAAAALPRADDAQRTARDQALYVSLMER